MQNATAGRILHFRIRSVWSSGAPSDACGKGFDLFKYDRHKFGRSRKTLDTKLLLSVRVYTYRVVSCAYNAVS